MRRKTDFYFTLLGVNITLNNNDTYEVDYHTIDGFRSC